MSEFRTALQALADAVSERHGFPEPEWISTKLAIAHHAAVALLARPEPEPRITREEAENLLDEYRLATEIMGNGVGFSSASREALIKMRNDARESCLAAMLRSEPAPSVRPERQTQTLYVFLQQRPRDKQPFPLVYVDQNLAEAAPHRVTPVVAVDVPMLPSPPAASDGDPE